MAQTPQQDDNSGYGLEAKVRALRDPATYPEAPRAIEVRETHMSWVFLTERHVYKLKKPVRYDFLDFSTFEKRRADCEAEVRLNRRFAPDVYLGIVALTADAHGALRLNGEGEAIEWLVKMRRLPDEHMLDQRIRAGRLDNAEIVDPGAPRDEDAAERVFFGATVTVRGVARGDERTLAIVGIDETDTARGYISWISPMARSLIRAREGDVVTVRTPAGVEELEVVAIVYRALATGGPAAAAAG